MTCHQKWFINWTVWKIRSELVDSGLNFVPAWYPLHNSPELIYCSWEAESDVQFVWLVLWELRFSSSPLTVLAVSGTTLAQPGSIEAKLNGLLCMFWTLCDTSSCNQAEHQCFPQSPSALNWPIELDIWRIESQTQISSCQKKLIQTGGSKTLVFFSSHSVLIFGGLMREMIINISSCALRQMPETSVNCFPLP